LHFAPDTSPEETSGTDRASRYAPDHAVCFLLRLRSVRKLPPRRRRLPRSAGQQSAEMRGSCSTLPSRTRRRVTRSVRCAPGPRVAPAPRQRPPRLSARGAHAPAGHEQPGRSHASAARKLAPAKTNAQAQPWHSELSIKRWQSAQRAHMYRNPLSSLFQRIPDGRLRCLKSETSVTGVAHTCADETQGLASASEATTSDLRLSEHLAKGTLHKVSRQVAAWMRTLDRKLQAEWKNTTMYQG